MEIEITKVGEFDGKEFALDQYYNIYERYISTMAWFEIFECNCKPETRNSSCEESK